jgi:hypothetical protein
MRGIKSDPAYDSDSGGRNETEFWAVVGSLAGWMAGIEALEVRLGKGWTLGETAVRWGYANARALDWTHGCWGFFE